MDEELDDEDTLEQHALSDGTALTLKLRSDEADHLDPRRYTTDVAVFDPRRYTQINPDAVSLLRFFQTEKNKCIFAEHIEFSINV